MAKPDLTFSSHGMFTRFYPETPDGHAAWDNIAIGTEGTGAVLTIHAAAVIRQLRKGGYVVAKAAPVTVPDDAILAALES